MTRTEHLLAILAEEATEVAHRCTKALRFGLTEVQAGHKGDNAQRLLEELGDLAAMVEMLGDEGHLPKWSEQQNRSWRAAKKERVERFLMLSAALRTLTDSMDVRKERHVKQPAFETKCVNTADQYRQARDVLMSLGFGIEQGEVLCEDHMSCILIAPDGYTLRLTFDARVTTLESGVGGSS